MAVAITVAFLLHARAWVFLCDDAFISFRYARNLAEHGALVFNVGVDPPERVEGYTNLGWVAVLAALHRLGFAPPEAAAGLTPLGSLAGLVAVTLVARALRRRFSPGPARLRAVDLVPAALLVSVPEYMVWSQGGLETSWAAALALGSIAAWCHDRPRLAAGLAAAAYFMRPDALLPLAAFGLVWLAVVGGPVLARERRAALARLPTRRLVQAALLFVVPILVHLMWRRSYYGAWLPNTWAIKAHGALLRDTYGQAYVMAWLHALPLRWVSPLALLLRPRHLLLVVPIVGVVGYGYGVGGDFMAYGRFYVVATALLATLVGWLLADAERLLARFLPAPLSAALVVLLGLGLAAGLGLRTRARWAADMAKPAGWLDGTWEGVAAMDRFARVGWAVGEWMHANLPPDTLITVGAAGAVPYGAGVPVVDAYGLVDPVLVRLPGVRPHQGKGARPGHQLYAPVRYIEQRDPDLLCHVGFRGERRPSERRVHPAFRRGYRWACIEPPPVADPRAPGGQLDVGVYCCRRPEDRIVGPFGPGDR